MNLQDYFKTHPVGQIAETARAAGTSLGYLRCCLYGQRRLSAEMAIRLEHASAGLITASELRPDLPWPSPRVTHEDAAP